MKKYKVYVCLEETYDDIEAESEDEAFLIASELAMQGGSWVKDIEDVSKDE